MLKVIDISSHNPIDVAAHPNADAVIVKATQGVDYINPSCDPQYQLAKASGKLLGVYHYAEGLNPEAEADFFYENIKGYIGEAIPALDWESYQNTAWGDREWCWRFVNRFYSLTNIYPLIYVQASALDQVANIASTCGLWVAGYPTDEDSWEPPCPYPYSMGAWNDVTIWQFTSGGNLDRNIAYIDADAWGRIARGDSGITPSQPVQPPAEEEVVPQESYSIQGKSLDELLILVMDGTLGEEGQRKAQLGDKYDSVQAILNARYDVHTYDEAIDTIAVAVLAGTFGNEDERKTQLGSYYVDVQNRVNTILEG